MRGRWFSASAGAAVLLATALTMRPVAAAPCKPPASPALLTGPVYASIAAECRWIDAIDRRDAAAAATVLHASLSQIDARGVVRNRTGVLADVARGRFGTVASTHIDVPFSAGSTNVVVSTWTFHNTVHRVTDVFFCDVHRACVYRLISEQITGVAW